MLSQENNDLLTRTGPGTPMGAVWRRFWLPALEAAELPEPDCAPVRLRLLNEDLVAWRNTDGSVGVMQNACPHRGASMFFGRNEENGLRCVYHGWKFDVTGACSDMPNEPAESNFKHKIRATAYPTRERAGLVWVYMGPQHLQPELPELEWTLLPDSHRYVRKFILSANYLQGMEGDFDPSHASFLHRWFSVDDLPNRRSFPSTAIFYDTAPVLPIRETDFGFVCGARRNTPEGRYHWRIYNWLLPSNTILSAREGLFFAASRVPVDDEHSLNFYISYHPDRPLSETEVAYYESGATGKPRLVPGTFHPVENRRNDYLIDREMQRTKNFTGVWSSAAQDIMVQESMGPIYDRTKEHLGTSDTAVLTARRILMRLARNLQQGIEPYAPYHGNGYRIRPLDREEAESDFSRFLEAHRDEALVR